MRRFKLVLMLALLCLSTSVFAQMRIYPSKELKAQPGETVQLVLSMENDVDILGWQFTLVNQNFFSVCKDEEDEYVRTASRVLSSHVVSAMDTESDPVGVMFTMYHPKNKPMLENDGEFISIDLKISEDATIGDYNLLLHEIVGSMPGDVAIYQDDLEIPIKIYAEYNISAVSANEKMGTVQLVGGGEAVESGTAITATATAVDGYEFVNWTDADGVEISTENPYVFAANKSVALTANFKAMNYNVTFDVDGEKTTTSLAFGSVITAPANPAKTGYTFIGWDPAFEEGATVPLNGITYIARWSINQYTLTFDTDGGSAVEAITQNYATEVTAPENPTKTGYTFVKWDPAVPETMPAENKTIKAVWQINQYTLTFDTDGGTEIPAIIQDYATEVTAPEVPVKEGHTFLGWDKDIPATMPAENVTITATWKINEYTFTFASNGGSEVASITLPYGSEVTAPENPTREGYTFSGWDTEIPATMLAEDKTFTAQWTINQYQVIFKAGETVVSHGPANYGTAILDLVPDMPETNEEGLPFVGWDPVIDENTTVPAHDVTYVAVYSGQFTISFDTNGGEEMAPIVMEYNAEIGEISNPVRPYYTFLGWTITDEKGKTYDEMPKNMPATNLVLTANWEIDVDALKQDLANYINKVGVPAIEDAANEVVISAPYDYYAVVEAVKAANEALSLTDADAVIKALDAAKAALDPYIQYCEQNGPAVSCLYTLNEEWGTLILPFSFDAPLDWSLYSCQGLKEDGVTLMSSIMAKSTLPTLFTAWLEPAFSLSVIPQVLSTIRFRTASSWVCWTRHMLPTLASM